MWPIQRVSVYLLRHTGKVGNFLETYRIAKFQIQKGLARFPSLFPLGRLFFLHAPLRRGRSSRGKSPYIRKYSEIRSFVSAGGRAPKNYYNQCLYQIPLWVGGSRIVFGRVPGQPEGELEKLDWHHRQWQSGWKWRNRFSGHLSQLRETGRHPGCRVLQRQFPRENESGRFALWNWAVWATKPGVLWSAIASVCREIPFASLGTLLAISWHLWRIL